MFISMEQLVFALGTIFLVLAFGIYKSRGISSVEAYSLAGRKASAPLVAGTIAGTVVGGGATVGTAQMAASVGLSAWWFTLGSGISLIIMGFFYATKLRQTGLETIADYLIVNYGKSVGVMMSILSTLGIFFGIVASFLPGIGIIAFIFNLSLWQSTLILIFFIILYVFTGGIKSAAISGIFKMAILWVSMFLAGSLAMYKLSVMPNIEVTLPPFPWYSLFGNGVLNGISNLLSMIVGIISTQTYIQALFSAKSPKVAMVGSFVAALIVIPIGLPQIAIGLYMHVLRPEVPLLLVLPNYLLTETLPFLGGVALGGILLSIIGSIAGLALGVGTMITKDIVRFMVKKQDEAFFLHINRLCVSLCILMAAMVAIFYIDSEILFWNYLSMSLRGCSVFLPLTIALVKPHALSGKWVLMSMVFSTLAAILSGLFPVGIAPLFLGFLVSALFLLLGYLSKKKRHIS